MRFFVNCTHTPEQIRFALDIVAPELEALQKGDGAFGPLPLGFRAEVGSDFLEPNSCAKLKKPDHLPSSHLVVVMPRMKTMAAKVPMIAA